MAQRAMRNRQFIGYTLVPLERNVRGRLFDSEGGGGGCQILFGQIIFFFGMGSAGNLFSCDMSSGKFIFVY